MFTRAGPEGGLAILVNFDNVFSGGLEVEAEDSAEGHGRMGEEIRGVVGYDDLPRGVGPSLLWR